MRTGSHIRSQSIPSAPPAAFLKPFLLSAAARHQHLCPRQVLGIRLGIHGLLAMKLLSPTYEAPFENKHKRLLTIVETDGCGADGIAIATNCHVGRRTLRVFDFGKVAATLIDTQTGEAMRVTSTNRSRDLAPQYAPEAESKWHEYLLGYQRMPDNELVQVMSVKLTQSVAEILSKPNMRAICAECGEEIMNEREMMVNGHPLCLQCAGQGYYLPLTQPPS